MLVALNSLLQIALYAPLALLYLTALSGQPSEHAAPFWLVAKSTLIFLGVPLVAGVATRYGLIAAKGRAW